MFPLANLLSIVDRAKEKGIIMKSMGQALELAPPLIIEKSDIDEGIKAIHECVAAEAKAMGIS